MGLENKIGDHKIALVMDTLNTWNADFKEIDIILNKYGKVIMKEAYCRDDAPKSLIKSLTFHGYSCHNGAIYYKDNDPSKLKDVDTHVATRATEFACADRYDKVIDLVAIAGGDIDYLPVIKKILEYGKKAMVLSFEEGLSGGLRNMANYIETLPKFYNNENNDSQTSLMDLAKKINGKRSA